MSMHIHTRACVFVYIRTHLRLCVCVRSYVLGKVGKHYIDGATLTLPLTAHWCVLVRMHPHARVLVMCVRTCDCVCLFARAHV